jgi:N-acetylglucosaminyl-diphospho-decaprenol L-rhamnosyltransferase
MTTSSPTGLPEPVCSLGVVIVNYRTYDLTMACVASVLEHGIARAEHIVVVDNASPDESGQRLDHSLPQGVVRVLSKVNGGFGAGVNLGIQALKTDLVLVLNPDTLFLRNKMDVVRRLFDQRPSLGVVGLKLINPDGSLQYSARSFYSLPDIVARRTALGRLGPLRQLCCSHLHTRKWSGGPFEADWVMGTGFVVRRHAFEKIGGMDEGYFLYFEEVDLCARMWVHGWRVLAVPEVELVHDHQRASRQGVLSWSGKIHLRSMVRFFSKFGVPWLNRPSRTGLAWSLSRWQKARTVVCEQHGA